METKVAENMPVLDIRKLEAHRVSHLARLFDKLEDKARRLEGADTLEKVQSLMAEIQEIDEYVGKLIGLKEIERAQTLVQSLIERRTSRVHETKPETIVGEEIPRIKLPPKPGKGSKIETLSVPLDKWT